MTPRERTLTEHMVALQMELDAERVRRWAETQRADRERTMRIAAEQDAGRCDVCARECVTIAVCGACELPEATR